MFLGLRRKYLLRQKHAHSNNTLKRHFRVHLLMKTSIKDVRDFPARGERHVEMMNGRATQMCSLVCLFFLQRPQNVGKGGARVVVRDGK